MNEKQWVRHISGQGQKWEVDSELSRHWRVMDGDLFMWLPKSEFALTPPPPPEVWRDVTEECSVLPVHIREEHWLALFHKDVANVHWPSNGYRLRKIRYPASPTDDGWAFIVERKES